MVIYFAYKNIGVSTLVPKPSDVWHLPDIVPRVKAKQHSPVYQMYMPIRQLCFSEQNSGIIKRKKHLVKSVFMTNIYLAFLAIRTDFEIECFKVLQNRSSEDVDTPVQIKNLGTIKQTPTESRPYAHIQFNPWYGLELGVIDEYGCWGIWEFYDEKSYNQEIHYRPPKKLYSGMISWSTPLFEQQWTQMIWGRDSRTIIVCNRREIFVISLNVSYV